MPRPDDHQRTPPRLGYSPIARNPISAALAFIAGTALLVAGFFFSLIVIAIVLGGGAIAGVYLWWKTRALRRAMREQLHAAQQNRGSSDESGIVVEGEVVREENIPPR